jgi:hypothetical protein
VSEHVINRFLAEVGASLPGPATQRDEILAELHDGLLEATNAHRQAGTSHDQAALLALREYGDPRTLARAFLPELSAVSARRIVRSLLAASPIVIALWMTAGSATSERTSRALVDWISTRLPGALLILATASCAAWMIAATSRAARWLALPPGGSLLAAAAIGGLSACADLAALLLLTGRLVGYPGTAHLLILGAAIAASATRLALATRASRACLAMRAATAPST